MFIIVKITKSAKFRNQFRRHDDDEGEVGEVQELRNEITDDSVQRGKFFSSLILDLVL